MAVAGLVYLLWATDSALPGMSSTRVTGVVILALEFAASASAVVPAFYRLIRGNRAYLVLTSLIGLPVVSRPEAAELAGSALPGLPRAVAECGRCFRGSR